MPRWQPIGPGVFALREIELSRVEACLQSESENLTGVGGRDALLEALANDRRVSPMLGGLVGSPMQGSRLDTEGLADWLLWDVARAGDTFLFDEEVFSRVYESWLRGIVAKEEVVRILSPLSRLEFGGTIHLDDDLEITQLSDEDVSTCLYVGAIDTTFPPPAGIAHIAQRVAVCVTVTERRGLYDAFSDAERRETSEKETAATALPTEVATALRLYAPGRVGVRGQVLVRPGGSMHFGRSYPSVAPGTPLRLTDEDQPEFSEFWRAYITARSEQGALAASIRRFSYAGERERRDDAIVDLVSALEGLLLIDIEDRRELTYRTALRGAVVIDAPGLTRSQVQRQLRRAYAVRSAVAHGGSPRASDLKSATGDAVTLEEFVDEIEGLTRMLLVKVIRAVESGASWPPNWDELILDGATYPNARPTRAAQA